MADTSTYCAELSKLTVADNDDISVINFLDNEFKFELALYLKMELTNFESINEQLHACLKEHPTAFLWSVNHVLSQVCTVQCHRNVLLQVDGLNVTIEG